MNLSLYASQSIWKDELASVICLIPRSFIGMPGFALFHLNDPFTSLSPNSASLPGKLHSCQRGLDRVGTGTGTGTSAWHLPQAQSLVRGQLPLCLGCAAGSKLHSLIMLTPSCLPPPLPGEPKAFPPLIVANAFNRASKQGFCNCTQVLLGDRSLCKGGSWEAERAAGERRRGGEVTS